MGPARGDADAGGEAVHAKLFSLIDKVRVRVRGRVRGRGRGRGRVGVRARVRLRGRVRARFSRSSTSPAPPAPLSGQAGYEVVLPKDLSSACCGMVFDSRGYRDVGAAQVSALEALLLYPNPNPDPDPNPNPTTLTLT